MKEFFKYVALLGIFFAVVFGIIDFKNIVIAFNEPVDINADYPEDYNDVKAVKTELDMILERYATEETVTESNGAITDRRYDYYYVVPVYTKSEENAYYVGVKVAGDDKKAYEKVCDATWAYLAGETDTLKPIKFEGGFVKMDEECYEHFENWFEENEWFEDKDDMEKYVLPLVLVSVNLEATKKSTFVLAGVIAVCTLIMVLCCRKGKEPEVEKYKRVTELNGKRYHVTELRKVHKMVEKGKKDKAVQELIKVTGLSEADANAAIMDWENLTSNKG